MSYGASFAEPFRQIGIYTGRIRSCSPRKSLITNLKTAKALGLTVPRPLLGRADEVIEWMAQCPLLALSGHPLVAAHMSAFGGKADIEAACIF